MGFHTVWRVFGRLPEVRHAWTFLPLIIPSQRSGYVPPNLVRQSTTKGGGNEMGRVIKRIFLGLMALILVGIISWKVGERRYLIGFLPPAFGGVTLEGTTSFVAGFGPGGHDATLAFFRLPDEVASSILIEGIGWLQSAETSVEKSRAKQAEEWSATPLDGTAFAWANESNCQIELSDWWTASHTGHSCPGIAAYLRGYGFLDRLKVSKTEAVDQILFGGGAYISKRRVGYLIVAPEQGLVVFAYAG